MLALNLSVIQLAQAAGFATTGSLNSARFGHASVLPNDGYLKKPFDIVQCFATLTVALRSRKVFDQRKRDEGRMPCTKDNFECFRLTNRENEVMSYQANGLLYKEIAEKLHISYSAVNQHLHNIYVKLQVNNGREAMRKWLAAHPNEFF